MPVVMNFLICARDRSALSTASREAAQSEWRSTHGIIIALVDEPDFEGPSRCYPGDLVVRRRDREVD